MYQRTITGPQMRHINRSAILELIRQESPIARSEIAQKLDISLPTVMRIVDELIEDDLVYQVDGTEWSGGRRRSRIGFNAAGHIVVGVDLGGTKMFGAVADLGGRVLYEAEAIRPGPSGEDSYLALVQLIQRLLNHSDLAGRKVRGIGIGAPGVTLHEEGVITWTPSLNWRNYPLKSQLAKQFELPVIVENDVNLAALGELWFGAGRNSLNMVLISIGTGVGAGIIINGALYRGAHDAAGEIGSLLPGRQFLRQRYEGFGALDSLASGAGVVERARQVLESRRSPAELAQLTPAGVIQAAHRGESWATELMDEAIDYLAIAVAGVSTLFDPEVIVLGGDIAGNLLIEPILNRIEGAIPVLPRLAASPLGRRAAVMGAIANVLHNTTSFYLVQKLS